MRRTAILLPAPLLLTLAPACKVVDAPDNLEAALVYGMVNHDAGDKYLEETALALQPMADANHDALIEGFRVDSLTIADLEAMGVDPRRELDVVGVSYLAELGSDFDEVVEVLAGDDLESVFSKTLEYELRNTGDLDCFLSKACDEYYAEGTRVTDTGMTGEATQDFISSLRWVELEDGSHGVFMRQLSPEETVMGVDWIHVYQSYSYAFLWPRKGGTWRLEGYWVDTEVIGMDVPDSFALDAAVGTMSERMAELDAYLAGTAE